MFKNASTEQKILWVASPIIHTLVILSWFVFDTLPHEYVNKSYGIVNVVSFLLIAAAGASLMFCDYVYNNKDIGKGWYLVWFLSLAAGMLLPYIFVKVAIY